MPKSLLSPATRIHLSRLLGPDLPEPASAFEAVALLQRGATKAEKTPGEPGWLGAVLRQAARELDPVNADRAATAH